MAAVLAVDLQWKLRYRRYLKWTTPAVLFLYKLLIKYSLAITITHLNLLLNLAEIEDFITNSQMNEFILTCCFKWNIIELKCWSLSRLQNQWNINHSFLLLFGDIFRLFYNDGLIRLIHENIIGINCGNFCVYVFVLSGQINIWRVAKIIFHRTIFYAELYLCGRGLDIHFDDIFSILLSF